MSVCKVILIGNVGQDPEVKTFGNAQPMATFSVATTKTWKDKETGEKKTETQWHRVVCFVSGLCTLIQNYVKKGSKIYVEGTLKKRDYKDKDGVEKSVVEVVLSDFNSQIMLLDKRGEEKGSFESDTYVPSKSSSSPVSSKGDSNDYLNDDIPF